MSKVRRDHFSRIIDEMIDFMRDVKENKSAESKGFKVVYSFLQLAKIHEKWTLGDIWDAIKHEEKESTCR